MLPLLPLAPSTSLAVLLLFACAFSAWFLELGPVPRRALAALWMFALCVVIAGAFAWHQGMHVGVLAIWSLLPVLAALALALPPALVVQWLGRRRKATIGGGPAITRRAALALPLSAGATAAFGFAQGVAPAELRPLPFRRTALHPDLVGLRILQLSDLHLGSGLDSRDLRRMVRAAREAKPDVVVLTGDVADKLEALTDGLPILEELAPRHGIYAVLGNHEYMSGVLDEMLDAYRASSVRLLVNESVVVRVGGARLAILGIDDPFGKHERDFFHTRVAACAGPRADFSLLLSHRPEALAAAADAGIDLTLSGHTHGGQIGVLGRSLAEHLGIARLMWGFYRRGSSTLYTSAGAGDWFPFRLGCPREAPLFELGLGRR